MKKFTLFAAAAFCALGASAQYVPESPFGDASVVAGQTQIFDVVLGNDNLVNGFKGAGQTVNDWSMNGDGSGADGSTRNFWIWDNTFVGGDGTYPAVGYSEIDPEGGYTALTVGNVGWSGGGFNYIDPAGTDYAPISSMHWNDNTRFHIAYMSNGTAPESVAFVIGDGESEGCGSPAKIAVGVSFDDGGKIYPTVGPKSNDDWQAIDISFAELKKVYPSFNYVKTDNWRGNLLSILAGGVPGQTISLDAFYFHTPSDDNAVGSVVNDAQFVVTGNTINVAGANSIELYDLSGRLVKKVNGSVMGISELGNGVFVARSGNSVVKIVK